MIKINGVGDSSLGVREGFWFLYLALGGEGSQFFPPFAFLHIFTLTLYLLGSKWVLSCKLITMHVVSHIFHCNVHSTPEFLILHSLA